MNIKHLLSRIPTLFAVALFACSGGDAPSQPEGRLLPAEEVYDVTAEEQRLREMQYLKFVSKDYPVDDRVELWDVSHVSDSVGGEHSLAEMLTYDWAPKCYQSPFAHSVDLCAMRMCETWESLRRARYFFAIAQATESVLIEPYDWDGAQTAFVVGEKVFTNPNEVVIPPQNSATRQLFARQAAAYFRNAVGRARISLELASTESCTGTAAGEIEYPLNSGETVSWQRLGTTSALAMQEAFEGLEASILLAVELNVNVADQQLGSSTQASIATARGMAGPELSRAAAAHLLVGGIKGIQGDATKALCSSSELTRQTRLAIDVIRDLAPPPSRIMNVAEPGPNNVALDVFLNDENEANAIASLRQRLVAYHGVVLNSGEYVEDYFGLTQGDFALAVKYLAGEIQTFSRSHHQLMAGSPTSPRLAKYAGIARPPTEMPDAYWGALARTDARLMQDENSQVSISSEAWEPWLEVSETLTKLPVNLADSLSWAALWLSEALGTAPQQLTAAIGSAMGGVESLGMFEHGYFGSGNDRFRVHLFRPHPWHITNLASGDYYIAIGDDALKCAVMGNVDGEEDCNPALPPPHLTAPTLLRMAQVTATSGFTNTFEVEARAGSRRVYLLQVRPGWVATTGAPSPGRGDFRAVLGLAAQRPTPYGVSGYVGARRIGIVPSVERLVAQHMKAAKDDCRRPLLSCGKAFFDERLPLENELSDDGDGIESSWKYYLAQAADAAAQSDALTKEYVEAELSQSIRAEALEDKKRAQQEKAMQELEGLQAICGTAVDATTLLVSLGWNAETGELNDPGNPGDCASPQDVDDGYICINGKEVRLWTDDALDSTDPEIQKLLACVADFTNTEPVMQMSRSPLCYWNGTGSSGGPCRGTPPLGASSRCPIIRPGTGACPSSAPNLLGVEQSFEWFDAESRIPPPPDNELCSYARRARALMQTSSGSLDERKQVEEVLSGSKIYNRSRLAELRSQLKVEAKYGDYVTVSLGGRRWITTGDARTGWFNEGWPCQNGGSAPTLPEDCANNSGLFCDDWQCSNVTQRRQLNDRLLDATIALEIISQQHLNVDNPGDTPYIEFWLPVLLAKGLTPKDYMTRPFVLADESVINERSNRSWKIYSYLDIPTDTTAFVRNSEHLDITGTYNDLYYNFAIGRRLTGADRVAATDDAFFGSLQDPDGMWETDLRGYFADRLINAEGHAAALEKWRKFVYSIEQPVEYGSGGFVQNFDGDWISVGADDWNPDYPRQASVFPTYSYESSDACTYGDNPFGPEFSELLAALREELHKRELGIDDNDTVDSTGGHQSEVCDPAAIVPIGEAVNLKENEQAVLDAFELVCEARYFDAGNISCGQSPDVVSMSDLGAMANFLDCKADVIGHQATTTILEDIPTAVRESIVAGEGADTVRGEIGQAISQLRTSLRSIADSGEEFRRIFQGFAIEMRQIESRVKIEELEDTLNSLHFASSMANNVAQCAEAIASASGWGKSLFNNGSELIAAGVTCGNSVVQTKISGAIRDTEQEINEEQRKIIFGDAETEFLRLEKAIADETARVSGEIELAQRALGTLEDLKQRARRSVDKAIWHLSYQNEKAAAVTATLSAQAITSQERYLSAHENAKRWAFLARRAIEQRLGVSLDSMFDELPLVEAPALWVNSACASSPVNYEEVTAGGGSFADAFIGDYVRKLENVVESYRLQFGFSNGADTAVVSMRDDILNVRADCEVPSKNLLYHASGVADAQPVAATPVGTWGIENCPLAEEGNGLGSEQPCVAAFPAESPFQALASRQGKVPGFEIRFGDGESGDCTGGGTGGTGSLECDWSENSRVVQAVHLTKGLTYRFSWYSPPAGMATTGPGKYVGAVWDPSGAEVGNRLTDVEDQGAIMAGSELVTWARHYREFTAATEGVYTVGFERPDDVVVPGWTDLWSVSVGAPMLEVVSSFGNADEGPSTFSNTGATLTEMRAVCEDSNGEIFRGRWSNRFCERVCPAGFGVSCNNNAIEQCYRELSFFIDQASIEKGTALLHSGFARGNFNYRLQSVGLNFVGTGIRDCANSTLPSTCYSGGFVPYSLYHRGPYYVRNHYGDDYRAYLFEGVIEHARGLAAERYLSNPISTSDKDLLADFTRGEYQGRPLDGQFTIRVWDEPGVNFSGVEDVQVVLNYQYWTR